MGSARSWRRCRRDRNRRSGGRPHRRSARPAPRAQTAGTRLPTSPSSSWERRRAETSFLGRIEPSTSGDRQQNASVRAASGTGDGYGRQWAYSRGKGERVAESFADREKKRTTTGSTEEDVPSL